MTRVRFPADALRFCWRHATGLRAPATPPAHVRGRVTAKCTTRATCAHPPVTASLAWLVAHPLSRREVVGSNPTGSVQASSPLARTTAAAICSNLTQRKAARLRDAAFARGLVVADLSCPARVQLAKAPASTAHLQVTARTAGGSAGARRQGPHEPNALKPQTVRGALIRPCELRIPELAH